MPRPATFWVNWLLAASLVVVLFGLLLVAAPDLARRSFSLMVFGDGHRLSRFDEVAVRYISPAQLAARL